MSECPREAAHTKQPDGYIAWHNWARRMSKTHRQLTCDGCLLLQIWVSK